MEAGLKLAVEAIHASPVRSVIFVAGGGSQALSWLLSTPGASDTVLEATVPYCRDSLAGIIGHEPEQYVSATTAREMAAAAYRRAVRLSTSGTPLAGVACTCALTSVVPKKGAHRCMVAAHTHKGLFEYGISLEKGRRSRFEEDGMASRLVLKALADACAVTVPVDLMLEHPGDVLTQSRHDHMDAVEGLLQGTYSTVQFDGPDVLLDAVRGHCFLPGSFNPVHRGHLRLLEIAARKAGQPACFELSVINADKPPLAREVVLQRVAQFQELGLPILLTREPLFLGKARLLPDSTFVVGYDTAVRLVNPKYYGDSYANTVEMLADVKAAGCKFLVAARMVDGQLKSDLGEVAIPPGMTSLFTIIPASEFREDISSTELRKNAQSIS
eukprot:jgi/Mesvir1/1692/Mv21152-RA.1